MVDVMLLSGWDSLEAEAASFKTGLSWKYIQKRK
jgi:hypothetical protein